MIISGSDGVTFPDSTNQFSGGAFSFKNRILNGDMRIDQRNAGAAVTPTGFQYTVDRWFFDASQASKFTIQQNAGSITPPAGFTNYLGLTVASSVSIGASDYFMTGQTIEGFNVADLNWGTANAKSVTLSFWVRSSLTGTFGGAVKNSAANRSYPFTYSVSASNTWEQKTVAIAGDTTGTWVTNNGAGLVLLFGLGVGSTLSGTAGAWAGANYLSATGATSVVGTNGATFYITGVQLEAGSVATPFERRPYGTELALCQRYCYQAIGRDVGSTNSDWAGGGYSVLTTLSLTPINVPVTMRSASGQSLVLSSSVGNYFALNGAGSSVTATAVVLDTPSVRCPVIGVTVASGLTVGQGSAFYVSSSANKAFITSEL
jgi:hypothetical protein